MKITKNTEYTVATQYKINYEKLSDLTNVEHLVEGDNLYVFNLHIKKVTTGLYEKESKEVITKIVEKELLDKICEHPENYDELEKQYHSSNPVLLVKKEFLPIFTQYGQYNFVETLGIKDIETHVSTFMSKDFIKDAKNDNYEFIQYLKNDHSYITIVDVEGTKYMEPIMMDYIRGQLSNEHYYLDELVEHLITRNDLAFMVQGKGYRDKVLLNGPLKGNEKGIDKIIEDIPGYNADENSTEYINVIYYPKNEDINKLLSWTEHGEDNHKKQIYDMASFAVKEILGGLNFTKKIVVEENNDVVIPKRKFKH